MNEEYSYTMKSTRSGFFDEEDSEDEDYVVEETYAETYIILLHRNIGNSRFQSVKFCGNPCNLKKKIQGEEDSD